MEGIEWRHGLCQCRVGCQCELSPGPAAYEVDRNKQTLKVCTRCTLSGDTNRKLLVTKKDPVTVLLNYDATGTMVIALEFTEET